MERLSKNILWMVAANAVNSVFGVILFIYLARVLMPESFGYVSYAFTLVFFLANFVDLGLATYGTRAIAEDRAEASRYVRDIVSLRLIVAVLLMAAAAIFVLLSGYVATQKIIILESLAILAIFAFATEWAFQGIERMHMVFVSSCVTSVLQVGSVVLFVKAPQDAFRLPALYFIATLPIAVIFLKYFKFRIMIEPADFKRMASYLSSSMTIWSISVFAQVYNGLDVFILGLFRPIEDVGYFTIARRVTGGITLFMIFLANALLPRLVHSFCNDLPQFKANVLKFLKICAVLLICLFVPIIIFSGSLISATVGADYLPAAGPLKVMVIGLILVLFNLPYSTGLIACKMEKEVLKQTVASAAVSIVLNFVLIPQYGMMGAAVSFLLAEAVALVWILLVYRVKVAGCVQG